MYFLRPNATEKVDTDDDEETKKMDTDDDDDEQVNLGGGYQPPFYKLGSADEEDEKIRKFFKNKLKERNIARTYFDSNFPSITI